MPVEFFPFTRWTPSLEHGEKGALVRLENLIPAWGGKRSYPLAVDGDDVAVRLLSCYWHDRGTTQFYAGPVNIYYVDPATAILTSVTGGPYTTGTPWRFTSFNNDVWAVNGVDPPQRRVNNAGNFANGVVSTFVPVGRYVMTVRDFMVIGHLTNVGRTVEEIAWSDISNPTNFDPGGASVAGTKIINSPGGPITGMVGGQYGLIFKARSIHVLQLTSGADVWRLDDVSTAVGTEYPASIVRCEDGAVRFWGGSSFYEQFGLEEPQPVGGDEISGLLLDRAFGTNALLDIGFNPSITDFSVALFGAEDRRYGVVIWFYAGTNDTISAGGNRAIAYNYRTKEWSHLSFSDLNLTCACTTWARHAGWKKPAQVAAARYENLTDGMIVTFDGNNNAWTIATARFTLGREGSESPARRVRIRSIQPVVTLNQATLANDYRLIAVPSALAVRLVWATDPHFNQKTDTISGTQVSPGNLQRTMADADEQGRIHFNQEGWEFLVEMSLAQSATSVRDIPGCWVDWEPIL